MIRNSLFNLYPGLSRLIVWVVFPVLLFLVGSFVWLKQSLPMVEGKVQIDGILSSINVYRDEYSIPKIEAENDLDAYFALGFVHAQDRLWQMEMNRHVGAGRLSEILGEKALRADIFMRTLGLYRNAKKMWANLSDENKEILLAYVKGVNTVIDNSKIFPIEFQIFNFVPEVWKPEDSLVWMQVLTWQLSGDFRREFQRSLMIQNFGIKRTNQLIPKSEPYDSGIAENLDKINDNISEMLTEFGGHSFSQSMYIGSNSWVVSGDYTESGAPILANDPHLSNSIPSIWYLARVTGRELNVAGSTFPGLPFVVIGKNSHITWGVTTTMADTQDAILEKINPLDRNQYEVKGKYVEMEVHYEEIKIKSDFLKPEKETYQHMVRRTRNGPVISDLDGGDDKFAYSLRWTGDDQDGGTFSSFIKLNYAKNWKDFTQALATYVAPVHNFIYADRKGNIGLIVPGRIPVRTTGFGSIPTVGWPLDSLWKSWIPYDEMPSEFNPEKGFIVSANNKIVSDVYPYHVSNTWSLEYRAERIRSEIERLIQSTSGKVTIEQMIDLQGDVVSSTANEVLPYLQKFEGTSNQQKEALVIVRNWNGDMLVNESAPTILSSWMSHFIRLLLEDEFSQPSVNQQAKPVLLEMINYDHPLFVENVLLKGQNDWCDYATTAEIESCNDILALSLDHAINELTRELGSDMTDWKWGRVHKAQYPHYPMSKSKLAPNFPVFSDSILSEIFHREIPSGGGGYTINVAPVSFNKESKYLQFFGASYRQVVDMSQDNKSFFIQNTGQSGSVLSDHYDDFIEKHQNNKYLPFEQTSIRQKLELISRKMK